MHVGPRIRPKVHLAPNNIWSMTDRCIRAANRARMPAEEIDEFRRQVYTASGYAEAWDVICTWFDVQADI